MARKHTPPSRLRYEASHPCVSLRVTVQELKKLDGIQKASGLSLAEVLRRTLGLHERRTMEAYEKGRRDGLGRFEAPCSVCKKPMHFDLKSSKDEKAKRVLLEAFVRWGHTPCLKRAGSGGQ